MQGIEKNEKQKLTIIKNLKPKKSHLTQKSMMEEYDEYV